MSNIYDCKYYQVLKTASFVYRMLGRIREGERERKSAKKIDWIGEGEKKTASPTEHETSFRTRHGQVSELRCKGAAVHSRSIV